MFNIPLDKQISGFSIPQELIISFNYTTPALHRDTTAFKALSWVARDWTLGGVLRYQSGQILQSPDSANNLLANLARGPSNNPAIWGGGYTFMNRVPGQPLFLVDPNSHFDPTTQLVLNPKAWVEPPYGTFGSSAAYFNDFRWQRQPAESLALGRVFSIKEKYKIQVRAEFQNIFNRLFYSMPSDGTGGVTITTPTGHANPGATLSSGFGYVGWLQGAGAHRIGADSRAVYVLIGGQSSGTALLVLGGRDSAIWRNEPNSGLSAVVGWGWGAGSGPAGGVRAHWRRSSSAKASW